MNSKAFYSSLLALGCATAFACSSSEDTGNDGGTGGLATGGMSTGGASTGGASTGGAATGGTSTGGVASGGTSSGGTSSGGSSSGGMGGMGGDGSGGSAAPGKPDLEVTLDDVESYTLSDTPESSNWTKWDPVAEISDGQAQSGTKSVGFFDTTGDAAPPAEAPEIQRVYGEVTEGVFQGSIYIVPEDTTSRNAVFTIFGEDSSSAYRLADFRFDGDGVVNWRESATGSWVELAGITFTPNSWVDIEIAWNSAAGSTGQVWLTVGDQEHGPIDLYSPAKSQIFAIKFGDSGGLDSTAAMYLDDFGLQLGL